MTAQTLIAAFKKHYPLLFVLAACWLLSTSMGSYTNWDAETEYQAAVSVLTTGYPIAPTGLMINQAPLCFYTTAAVMQFTGEGYVNGVAVIDAFGLCCVAAVYALGAILYGRKTGLVAAALFGFSPWHVFLSRIYLIDNEYLFLCLVFLGVGALATKRNSEKLVLAAGVIFALAMLTKLFAVFALVPMALIVYFNRRNGVEFKLTRHNIQVFAAPTLISHVFWYGVLARDSFMYVFFNTDFTHPNQVANPILAFVPVTMVNSGGYFVFAAAGLALTVGLAYRRRLATLLRWDLVMLLSIAFVVGLNTFIAVMLHSNPAYISAVKYSYMALPFFCIVAASTIDKGMLIVQERGKWDMAKLVKVLLTGVGAALIFASLLEGTMFLNKWHPFASFGVDTVSYFPFFLNTQAPPQDTLTLMQYAALGLAVFGMFVATLASRMKRSLSVLILALKS